MAEEYLEHYGVLGMHWGIRKDGGPQGYNGTYPTGKSKKARRSDEVYTPAQRKRDERLYSPRGAKRIAKRIDKGESIVSARHPEVKRNERRESRKRIAKRAGKTAVTVLGGAAIAAGAAFLAKMAISKMSPDGVQFKDNDISRLGQEFVAEFLNRWANPF